MTKLAWTSLLVGGLLLGCGGDDGGGGGSGDVCETGCEATLAAACSNGPESQAECVADCNMLRTGTCATEYEALLSCSDGKQVTCSSSGIPEITGCETQQAAFIACLNPGG